MTSKEQRIPAHLSAEGYSAANEAFLKAWSGDEEELQTFLRTHIIAATAATTTTTDFSVLSIGSGNGRRDVTALRTLLQDDPGIQANIMKYTAVEPNQAQMDQLISNMRPLTNIQVTTHVQKAEDYNFGNDKEAHDLVLFTHSLYHMPGSEREVLQGALASLKKPSGRVVVALSTEKGGIFQMMGSFWSAIDYSHFEKGGGKMFGQESLTELLEENNDKYKIAFEPLPKVHINVQGATTDLLNFIMQCDTTKLPPQMVKNIKCKLGEMAPDSKLSHGSGMFCISPIN